MIVVKYPRKDRSFAGLMEYIHQGANSATPAFTYNLNNTRSREAILAEFQDNANLVKRRHKGNYLYHDILSFHPEDAPKLTTAILHDLANKYLELRTQGKSLGYGVAHLEPGKNPHLHLMISANAFGESKKIDLKGRAWTDLRLGIEAYQMERYPFLEKSIVFHKERKRKQTIKKTRKEEERERRLQKDEIKQPSRKETLQEKVLSCLTQSHSETEFASRLNAIGLKGYKRGKNYVVIDENGIKHRLKTLGLMALYSQSNERWGKQENRTQEMNEIKRSKARRFWKEIGLEQKLDRTYKKIAVGNRKRKGITANDKDDKRFLELDEIRESRLLDFDKSEAFDVRFHSR